MRRDDDGTLTAKVESEHSGPRIKSKACASSGSDIVTDRENLH